jgi:hypothetical protein
MKEFTHSFYACEIAEVVYDAREVAALLEAKDKLILKLEQSLSACRDIVFNNDKTDYDKYVDIFNVLREGKAV